MDNLVDRIFDEGGSEETNMAFLQSFSKHDTVILKNVYLKNVDEIYTFFKESGANIKTIGKWWNDEKSLLNNIEDDISNFPAYTKFKDSFQNQFNEIRKFIHTPKIAVIMPFSTRKYAVIQKETLLKIAEMLYSYGYTSLICGERISPYSSNPNIEYNQCVTDVMEFLDKSDSPFIVNLLGMGASKVAELSSYGDIMLHASTGAIQISSYGYSTCPWIILENGFEGMMSGLSRTFCDEVNIVDVTCPHKYCQFELESNPNHDKKIKTCHETLPECMGKEFNFESLENYLKLNDKKPI
jgi:hypothetical protein